MTTILQPENLHTVPAEIRDATIADIKSTRDGIQGQTDLLFSQGQSLVESATNAMNAIATSVSSPVLGPAPSAPTIATAPTAPVVEITANAIAAPYLRDTPSWQGNPTPYSPADIVMPDVPVGTPDLNVPAMPSPTYPSAPSAPAIPSAVVMPVAPSIQLPNAPALAGVSLPTIPVIDLPTFDNSLLPTWSDTAPTLPDIAGVPVVVDDSMLQSFGIIVQNMDPATLAAVYDQELARQADAINRQLNSDIEGIMDEFAARGHVAPQGAIAKRTDGLRADASAKVRAANRDLALARMQQELDVYKANIQTGADLAKLEVDRDLQATRLRLDVLVAGGRSMIDLYNALVEVFKAKQSSAQVAADVYRAMLQGEMSKVDLYGRQVDAQKLAVDASVAQMQGYDTEVRGIMSHVDLYRAQIEGAKAQVEAQAQVLDVFKVQVEAYVAQIGGVKAQFDAYDSQVRGAIAPVQMYESRMRGYASSVEGAKALVEIERTRADIAIKQDELALSAFTASVDAAVKDGQLKVETVRANAAIEQTRLTAADTQARATIAGYQGSIEAYKASSQVAVSTFDAAIQSFKVNADINTQRMNLHLEAAKGTAQVSAQLAASALAGLHIQQSLSSNTNLGFNASNQGSWNYSIGEQHSFQGE